MEKKSITSTSFLGFHLAHAPKPYDPDDHIDYLDATVHFDDTCQVRVSFVCVEYSMINFTLGRTFGYW